MASPLCAYAIIASSNAFSTGMLRARSAASWPSARNHVACGRAHLTKQRRQHDAGPFALARESCELLGRDLRRRCAIEVARAFEETDARHRRKPFEIREREHRRTFDHSVDQQRVAPGIDLRDA